MKETRARELVIKRSHTLCERCGGAGAEYSHRRTRGVKDDHEWCPCNALRLCRGCHRWAHEFPSQARWEGVHVSRYMENPRHSPVRLINGWWFLTCEGGARYLGPRNLDFSAGM